MADKEKEDFSEEYQFPKEEYAHVDAPKSTEAGEEIVDAKKPVNLMQEWFQRGISAAQQFKNKRLLIAIGAVFLVIIILYVFSIAKEAKPKMPSITDQSAVTTQAPAASQSTDDNAVLGTLDSLRAHSSHSEYQIRDLHSAIADMKQSIAQSQAVQAELQKSITALSDQVNTLSTRFNDAIAALNKPANKKALQVVYHLRVVLPDRAWLISNSGQTLTVTVGDRIDQYGVVKSIDSTKGVVRTSSGRDIYYGENDF